MEVIRHFTTAKLNDPFGGVELSFELKYYRTDPLAVAMVFGQKGYDTVEWQVSRDMLRAGLEDCVGIGDVNFWPIRKPGKTQLSMMFHSDETATAQLIADADEVKTFLDATERLVPFGEEEELVMAGFDDWLEDHR